jgi:hypothetical protein
MARAEQVMQLLLVLLHLLAVAGCYWSGQCTVSGWNRHEWPPALQILRSRQLQ